MGEVFAGRYELADPIGRGGVGAVWRAWDHRRHRYVAAKVLQQRDAHTLLRFVREQSVRIDHPHVLAPASWAADDDQVLFTMGLVAGGSLAHLIGDYGPLPPQFVSLLLDQLLSGLAAVHAEGIVHRDIKPANILLEATGTGRPHLRLSDFGISMRKGEPRLTEANYVVGTPGYFAPEQAMGAEPDFPADLFAVGLVALHLLQGQKPDAKALVQYFATHGTPGAPKNIPEPLWQVLAGLVQPDPHVRFRTATGARKALLAVVELLPEPGPDDEIVEVFDHLGPLPTGFGPHGPYVVHGRATGTESSGRSFFGGTGLSTHGTSASGARTTGPPATPSTPLGPDGPDTPGTPASPGSHPSPGSSGSPGSPQRPSSPLSPGSPDSPGSPGNPMADPPSPETASSNTPYVDTPPQGALSAGTDPLEAGPSAGTDPPGAAIPPAPSPADSADSVPAMPMSETGSFHLPPPPRPSAPEPEPQPRNTPHLPEPGSPSGPPSGGHTPLSPAPHHSEAPQDQASQGTTDQPTPAHQPPQQHPPLTPQPSQAPQRPQTPQTPQTPPASSAAYESASPYAPAHLSPSHHQAPTSGAPRAYPPTLPRPARPPARPTSRPAEPPTRPWASSEQPVQEDYPPYPANQGFPTESPRPESPRPESTRPEDMRTQGVRPPRGGHGRRRKRPGPPPKVAVPVLLLALLCFTIGFWALSRA
ncbi:serine/threonine-protein kinase [Streptomyces tsukubensis]|uniref:non-specific serine/threonine protein kinase n=1 Tax=Streptomyces tsukubensis TaxID=83656 RepID=A0A1V4AA06_9ACTN|nr:serine/threonine-protein kinase [Streptomyces tsukubensis]OON79288.1 hypothetical protein B1H18_15175 [Streptomyces tsukubensis]QFR94595.1 protein kinase [Streptomyces tsukubensis]